VKQKTGALTFV